MSLDSSSLPRLHAFKYCLTLFFTFFISLRVYRIGVHSEIPLLGWVCMTNYLMENFLEVQLARLLVCNLRCFFLKYVCFTELIAYFVHRNIEQWPFLSYFSKSKVQNLANMFMLFTKTFFSEEVICLLMEQLFNL